MNKAVFDVFYASDEGIPSHPGYLLEVPLVEHYKPVQVRHIQVLYAALSCYI